MESPKPRARGPEQKCRHCSTRINYRNKHGRCGKCHRARTCAECRGEKEVGKKRCKLCQAVWGAIAVVSPALRGAHVGIATKERLEQLAARAAAMLPLFEE